MPIGCGFPHSFGNWNCAVGPSGRTKWTHQVDGRNVRIDRRWPLMTSIEMLMLPKELVGLQPDAIFAS